MNAAEIKLDLFRRLDSLDGSRLERVYERVLALISSETKQPELSAEVKTALDEALESSKLGRVVSHEEANRKTKEKYPNLFS
jgi:predicted transcriptional regulator